ncbi:MAG TPA: hypothetical protein VJH70_00550 [Candidatus Paceibacterota bacterium]
MLAILLAFFGTVADEISSSIVKTLGTERRAIMYRAILLNSGASIVLFLLIGWWRNTLVFQAASLPTFLLRAVFEIIQITLSMNALLAADRSTFAFMRNITIPLLLIVDVYIGYAPSISQWWGMAVILVVLSMTLKLKVLNMRGAGISALMAANAVITISLFKYNTAHFNSVEIEQALIYGVLAIYLWWLWKREHHNLLLENRTKKIIVSQSIIHSLASVFVSFAVSLGTPAVITTATRASGVLAGIVSGHNYFKERGLFGKLLMSILLIGGLVLLTR